MKKIIKFYFLADFLLIAFSIFIGKIFLLNTQVGFLGALLIILISFKSLKDKISTEALKVRIGESEISADEADEADKKPKIFSKAAFYFFAPLKILAYAGFFAALYYLNKFSLFSPSGLICGISIIPLVTLIFKIKE